MCFDICGVVVLGSRFAGYFIWLVWFIGFVVNTLGCCGWCGCWVAVGAGFDLGITFCFWWVVGVVSLRLLFVFVV